MAASIYTFMAILLMSLGFLVWSSRATCLLTDSLLCMPRQLGAFFYAFRRRYASRTGPGTGGPWLAPGRLER